MAGLQSIADIPWDQLTDRTLHPSPKDWRDQVMYFLMVDRFSDAQEEGYGGTTPLLTKVDRESVGRSVEAHARWQVAGDTFCGGNLVGVRSKLGYLQRLGITTLWLSPVLKQPSYDATAYHGYGTQDFLSIDPHFGTAEDLRDLVREAHELEMYVVLDIIVNHAGNVFSYTKPDTSAVIGPPFNQSGKLHVAGFHDEFGKPSLPFAPVDVEQQPGAYPNGAIWPIELQHPECFSQRGSIVDYENQEHFLHGDFMKLKDLVLSEHTEHGWQPTLALKTLTDAYRYWLLFADLDGFRIDAVKHMEPEAVAYFVKTINNTALRNGKANFLVIGEVAGGRTRAASMMSATGLDAVLAVDDVPGALERVAKGLSNPDAYFQYFSNQAEPVADQWQASKVITMYDDHDQIRNGYNKARFAAGDPEWLMLSANALAMLVTTQGIPGIYYGSEQAFDGSGADDNYIREAMFGGPFGPFRSTGRHCFDEQQPIFQSISRLLRVRQTQEALRYGSQQLLAISGDGEHYGLPHKLGERLIGLIPWLRWTDRQTLLCILNTDPHHDQTAWVQLPAWLVEKKVQLRCLYSSDLSAEGSLQKSLQLTVPAAGFVIFEVQTGAAVQ